MRVGLCLLVLSLGLCGQQNPATIRDAMQQSVARQRESVQRQMVSVERHLAAAVPGGSADGDCEPLEPGKLDSMIAEAAGKEQLDPKLVREVARQESGFRPCAVSPKGALGLMQLMPATAGDLGVRNPFDPRESLSAGTQFLRQLIDRYSGDIRLAIAAYNAGPGRVDRARAVPDIPETQRYVRDIIARMP